MTENIDPRTDPQFKALMQVMNDITQQQSAVLRAARTSSAKHIARIATSN
jgi:hypothetical protein